jgi:hypothetical protein
VLLASVVVVAGRRAWALTLSEAIGRLARERSFAESGAGLLKLVAAGDLATPVEGQKRHAQAKARFDELIDTLKAAMTLGDEAAVAKQIEAPLDSAVSLRLEFSRYVEQAVGEAVARSRVSLVDALAEGLSDIATGLIEGAIEIWKEVRRADGQQRSAIVDQPEGERWLAFNAVPTG